MFKISGIVRWTLFIFVILFSLNLARIYVEFKSYENIHFQSNIQEINTIKEQMQKVADALFDNVVNTQRVIDIFKYAKDAKGEQKDKIRTQLYYELVNNYANFKQYGIQQFHFHLPNNESFLRFHKIEKYGDNLTKIRDSVKYVNSVKKRSTGFEEGRIFNGYRYVYPLFDENNIYIGSVEVSSALITFKKVFQKNNDRHIDFILNKDDVQKKVFSSQLQNYTHYHGLDDFLIRTNINEYNKKTCAHDEIIASFLHDKDVSEKIKNINNHIFSQMHNGKIYTLLFIPLLNDFNLKQVGYMVIFHESEYLANFKTAIFGSFLSVFFFSILLGYIRYFYLRRIDSMKQKHIVEQKNEELQLKNQLINSIIDGTEDFIFYKDKYFQYIGCNDAFAKLIDISEEEIIGKNDFELFDKEVAQNYRDMDNQMLKSNKITHNYEWFTYKSGKKIYVYTQKIPFIYNKEKEHDIGVLSICRDVTELYKTQEKLKEQTYRDELTQVRNRKSYNEKIEELMGLYKRYGVGFTLIMFDIDNFKYVNDTFGHLVGDEVLRTIGHTVRPSIRQNDYFFRIGGEEFVILLSKTVMDGAYKFADNLRKNIQNSLRTPKGEPITVSIGLAIVKETDDVDSLFKRADDCMYRAKRNGKNRVVTDEDLTSS